MQKTCIDPMRQQAYFFQMNRTGRLPRIHQPNTIHHVMMRGNNRQRIFFGDDYFKKFLEILGQSTKKFDHKILSYCLMTNHIHLIVHINHSSLSRVMQNINFRYARWANFRKKFIGHLFQARYHSLPVSNENYLVNLCRYVHLNPVSAKMVEDPLDYRWSSHHHYAFSHDAPIWLDTQTIKEVISRKTGLEYLDFMLRSIEREKWMPALYYSNSGNIVIEDTLIKNANNLSYVNKPKKKVSPDYVANIICEILNFDSAELYLSCKNHHTAKMRALIGGYWIKYSGMTLTEIAMRFERSTATVHKQIVQLSCQPNKYFDTHALQKINDEIQKNIQSIH